MLSMMATCAQSGMLQVAPLMLTVRCGCCGGDGMSVLGAE